VSRRHERGEIKSNKLVECSGFGLSQELLVPLQALRVQLAADGAISPLLSLLLQLPLGLGEPPWLLLRLPLASESVLHVLGLAASIRRLPGLLLVVGREVRDSGLLGRGLHPNTGPVRLEDRRHGGHLAVPCRPQPAALLPAHGLEHLIAAIRLRQPNYSTPERQSPRRDEEGASRLPFFTETPLELDSRWAVVWSCSATLESLTYSLQAGQKYMLRCRYSSSLPLFPFG
jgi:hypothetical protein